MLARVSEDSSVVLFLGIPGVGLGGGGGGRVLESSASDRAVRAAGARLVQSPMGFPQGETERFCDGGVYRQHQFGGGGPEE